MNPPHRPYPNAWESLAWLCLVALNGYLWLSISDTLDWKMVHDAPIMHYIAWNILDGAVPYRDIFDMNMPGTYLIHMGVLKIFGEGDPAWRLFDIFILALTSIGMIIFCWRQGLLAGVTAATLFACFHISGGELMVGQRDFLMTPFLIFGGHFVANIIENRQRMLYSFLAGILFGCAIWIKPYVLILFVVLLLYAKIQSKNIFVSLLMILGFLLPVGGMFGWLYMIDGLLSWWEIFSQYLVPIYSSVGNEMTKAQMVSEMLLTLAVLLPFLALSTPLTGRFFVSLSGVIFGVIHYIIQGKGWHYHLSPLLLWASVFVSYRIGSNIKAPKTTPRFAALIGISMTCALASPLYLLTPEKIEQKVPDQSEAIYSDLKDKIVAGDTVQVMDHTSGGIHALLKLHMKQPTRFLRDFHLYASGEKYYVQRIEDEFIHDLTEKLPKAIVLTRESWPSNNTGFDRIKNSPRLSDLLQSKYHVEIDNPEYRIYLRN